MSRFYLPLCPGKIYRVFNHAVGNELLFRNDQDYKIFLTRLKKHIWPIGDIIAWTLLPDHFEMIVNLRSKKAIRIQFEHYKQKAAEPGQELSDFVMERFANLLNSYSKSYNNAYDRKGALFIDYSKREFVANQTELINSIVEMHIQPEMHGLVEDFDAWAFSSYSTFLDPLRRSKKQTEIVSHWGIDEFKAKHALKIGMQTKLV